MITLDVDIYNPISQKSYDEIIDDLQIHMLTCSCGHSSCLIFHGNYKRYVKNSGEKVQIFIKRVKCRECKRTHALLLSGIIPYSQIALSEQVEIISAGISGSSLVIENNLEIDENNVWYILRQFRYHYEQRLISEGIGLKPYGRLIRRCFTHFGCQFMQIKRTPNILFLRPT